MKRVLSPALHALRHAVEFNLGAQRMTNFLRKLTFWRKSADGGASGPVPSGGANDSAPPTPEQQAQLDYEAERREEYFQERLREDEFQQGGRSREEEYLQEQRDEGDVAP
jgi:hypothetical protein